MPTLTVSGALLAPLLAADLGHSFGSILLAILGIGFLIFIHELGHFLACRLTRTRVETFAIGFGPRLFGWERSPDGVRSFTVGPRRLDAAAGAMDVRISAIPLGGYVKMAGEIGGDGSPASGADDEDRRPPAPDEFPAKPLLARVFIISAGVLMNVVTAFALYWAAYAGGMSDTPPVVGAVSAGGPAWRAGVQPGDRVLSVNGRTVRTFGDVQTEIVHGAPDEDTTFVVRRGERTATLGLRPEYDAESGFARAQIRPITAWTVDDGKSPAFTVGALERVLVEGRQAVGGMGAFLAVSDAIALGYPSVRVEFPDRPSEPPRSVDLGLTRKWSASGPFALGLVAADRFAVGSLRPDGAAARAGLLVGDEIVAADGRPLEAPERLAFLPSIGELTVRRATAAGGSDERRVPVGAADPAAVARFVESVALGGAGTGGPVRVVPLGTSFEDGKSPAGEAGVRPGDRVLAVGDGDVATWGDLLKVVASLPSAPVKLRVQTGAEPPREVFAVPRPVRDPRGAQLLGLGDAPRERIEVGGPLGAAGAAASRTWTEVTNIFRLIRRFFDGQISFKKNVGGPFTIATISSSTLSLGWTHFLYFLAFISVNLAVLNILPIPVLDGGHLLFLFLEKLRGGRPLREATIARFQMVGFLLLLVLMAFALRNDVRNLFGF